MKILPPVSKKYKIDFDSKTNWAFVDLTNVTNPKVFYNSIFNTIIVNFQNDPERVLKGITFTYSDQQKELYNILCRQMDLFNLVFNNKVVSTNKFIFDESWKEMIEMGLEIDFSKWEAFLSEYDGLLTYKTVTEKYIQLRYFGYQIAKFDPSKNPGLENIKLVNNSTDVLNFADHYKLISDKRSQPEDNEKLEHFLESSLLKKIQENSLIINGNKIEKLFDNKLSFQFPTLWKTGAKSRSDNSPKYADIFAKIGNRPTIMELKVHKDTGNSRGEYVFQAFGQVINYFVFLNGVFNDNDQVWGKHLNTVRNLEWKSPSLYVITDYLGSDKTAEKFRSYIKNIKKYIKSPDIIKFIEVDANYKFELKVINEI